MNEQTLKASLIRRLKDQTPGAIIFAHSDRRAGIPDLSFTWLGKTSWYELKYATPNIRSRGIQDLTLAELDKAGIANYIIFEERNTVRRTIMVKPNRIFRQDLFEPQPDEFTTGFDFQWVCANIRRIHWL